MQQPSPPAGPWPPPAFPPPPAAPFAPPGAGPAERANYGSRAAAWFIDVAITAGLWLATGFIVGFVLGFVVALSHGTLRGARTELGIINLAVLLATAVAYPAILLSRRGEHNGQTWGKQAMNLRVVRADGRPMTFGRALLREGIGKQLLALVTVYLYRLLDYLWPLWDRGGQALHDKIASTNVVPHRTAAAFAPAPSWATPAPTPASAGMPGPAPPPPPAAPPAPASVPPPAPPPPPGRTYGGFAPPTAPPSQEREDGS